MMFDETTIDITTFIKSGSFDKASKRINTLGQEIYVEIDIFVMARGLTVMIDFLRPHHIRVLGGRGGGGVVHVC